MSDLLRSAARSDLHKRAGSVEPGELLIARWEMLDVTEVVMDAVKAHLAAYGSHESGLLLATDSGGVLTTSTLHGAWQRAARKVGTVATPHDLRHYFASVQIRGGQSIKVLQALLGHKSAVETWDTYGHLMDDEDSRSRSIIDAALRHAPSGGGAAGVSTE